MAIERKNLILKNVRLSFAQYLFNRGAFDMATTPEDKWTYSCSFLISKEDKKQVQMVWDAIEEMKLSAWDNKVPSKFECCFKDGDIKYEDDPEKYPEFRYTMVFGTAKNRNRVPVVNRDGKTPITEDDGIVYSGCYVNGHVGLWLQNTPQYKRINASLRGIQFVSEGEPFGSAPISLDEFEELDDPDNDSDLGFLG